MNTRTPNRPATRTATFVAAALVTATTSFAATTIVATPADAASGDGNPRTERVAVREGRVVHNALQERFAEAGRYPERLTRKFWSQVSDRPAASVRVRGYVLRDGDGEGRDGVDTYRYCVVHRDGGWATFDNRDDRDARYPAFVASGESGAECRFPAPEQRDPDAGDVLLGTLGLV